MAMDGSQDSGFIVRPQLAPAAGALPGADVLDAQPADVHRSRWRDRVSERLLTVAAFAVAAVVLFAAYYREASGFSVGSDGSSNLLQAWDMLHGNLLLSGWTLADVSFYTMEIPEYAIVAAVRGVSPGAMYAGAALTYTVVALLTVVLAKGRATGRTGLIRALIAGGIMLAPTWGGLLTNPDHLGTQAALLLMWLMLDRASRRWWVPVAAGVLLAWAQMSDTLALYEGAAPLAAVCALRMYRRRLAEDPRETPLPDFLRANWYEASLTAAAFAGAVASVVALRLITVLGGFSKVPATTLFAPVHDFGARIGLTIESVLVMYSADFSGHPLRTSIVALIHMAGLALAVWALARAFRRFWQQELMIQVLVVTAGLLLVAYTFTGNYTVGSGAHEIVGLLPIGAVLAGRLVSTPLARARLLPVLAVVGVMCAFVLVHEAARTPNPDPHAKIAAWLQAHHLDHGLASYWDASLITVVADNRVQVRPISRSYGKLVNSQWDSVASWYVPSPDNVDMFFLLGSDKGCPSPAGSRAIWLGAVQRAFGPPSADYRNIGGYDVLVWNNNLLDGRLPHMRPLVPPVC